MASRLLISLTIGLSFRSLVLNCIWAASWQNQQCGCAPSEDSDQPGQISYPLSAQQRLWSDWADAQADLSLRWAHTHFVGFVMRRLIFSVTGERQRRRDRYRARSDGWLVELQLATLLYWTIWLTLFYWLAVQNHIDRKDRSVLRLHFFMFSSCRRKEPRALSKLFGLPILLENQNVATGWLSLKIFSWIIVG